MKRLAAAWSAWVALSSRREDAAPLAMARIVCGATIAVHLIGLRSTGAVEAAWVDQQYGGGPQAYSSLLFELLGGCTPRNVHGVMAAGVVAAGFMTVGLYTRVAVVATWLCFRSLTNINWNAGGSADDLLINGLFVLMLSGCGRALSVDLWLRRRLDPAASSEAPAWPRYVLIFQLITLYWTTGIQKISNSWWPPPLGSADALWFIVQQVTWSRWTIDPRALAPFYRLTQLATASVWLFEVGALALALAYWYRHTRERPGRVRRFFNAPLAGLERWLGPTLAGVDFRLCYLAFGFCMHFGIWALMEVGPFFNAVLVLYACCLTPAEWRAFLGRRGGGALEEHVAEPR